MTNQLSIDPAFWLREYLASEIRFLLIKIFLLVNKSEFRQTCLCENLTLFCFPGILSYEEAEYWWEKSKPCNMGMFAFLTVLPAMHSLPR